MIFLEILINACVYGNKTKEGVKLRHRNRHVKSDISRLLDFETLRIKQNHLKSSHLEELFNYIHNYGLCFYTTPSLHKDLRYILLMNIGNCIIQDKKYNKTKCLSKIFSVVKNFARLHLKELHIEDPKIPNSQLKTINFDEFDEFYYEYLVYQWFMKMFNIEIIFLGDIDSKKYLVSIQKLKLEDMDVFDKYYKKENFKV
ncbi:uncharacterized protein VNE69_01071 [Vairimorpha necatrix]|uniref:LAGLIDADG homing endonuclease n=1 Tax=Vairimorpha necatrix TaxID=6039 RepID=A0AAX4J8D7_9MICR